MPLIVWVYSLSSFKFFWWAPYKFFSARVTFRPFRVIGFRTNRKHVYMGLPVSPSCHRNLYPILHHFRDMAGFVLMTPMLFRPNFGGVTVPVGPDRPIGVNPSRFETWPIIREIIFKVFQPMWTRKPLLSQRRPRDASNIWVPWKVSRVLANAPGYFSRNL